VWFFQPTPGYRFAYVPDGPLRYLPGRPRQGEARKAHMAKHSRRRLSWEDAQKIVTLLIGAIEPVAKLITAISRLR
jgi:hypothetical protein